VYAFTLSILTPQARQGKQSRVTTVHGSVYRRRRSMHRWRWRWRRRWRDAPVGVAAHPRLVQERDALLARALVGAPGDAVLAVVDARHLEAPVRLAAEEVVRVGEVLEVRQAADALRYLAGEAVVRDVELLQRPHVADRVRQGAGDAVEAEVQHGELVQLADLGRDAGGDAAVEQDQLVERGGHVADAARQAAADPLQVGQHDHRRRRVGEAVGQRELEVVVVDEERVDLLVEDGRRHLAAEVVEPDVHVLDVGEAEELRREGPGELVVADVDLVEEVEGAERVGEGAAEAVGVEVEDGEVGQEAQLLGERPGEVAVVEVHGGHRALAGVVGRRRAEHAEVAAHVGPAPVLGQLLGVVRDGALQRLQRHVRLLQPGVVRGRGRRRHARRWLRRGQLRTGGREHQERRRHH
jgi:hypothetical protein